MINVQNMAETIANLQNEFGKLDRINPTGKLATGLRNAINAVENADALRIIHAANIKWVSTLALTQLIIRGERTA